MKIYISKPLPKACAGYYMKINDKLYLTPDEIFTAPFEKVEDYEEFK